jgi:PAS domain S-box-containing protein
VSGGPPAAPRPAWSLAESEARLRAVFESAVDGIVVIDAQGLIEAVNPAAERMFGHAAAALVGQNVRVLMPEPYHSEHDGYIARYLRTGEARVIGIGREVVGRRRDGGVFPMDLAISEMRLGAQRKFVGLVRDISERKRHFAELAAAREAAARYQLLVESVQDYAIVLLDAGGAVSSWNAGAGRIAGYRPEEIVGRHFEVLYPPEDRAAGAPGRALEEAARRGRLEAEGWRLRRDGTRFWASVALTALRDGGGAPAGFAMVTRDLTERRRAEAELRDRETRLRTLVETTADGIVVFNPQGRIESFNAAAERLFGYAFAEVRNRDVRLLSVRPLDAPAGDLAALMQALRGEGEGRRKDGGSFPMEVAVSDMAIGGQRLATALVRDITARRQAEAELRRLNQSLEDQVRETRAALERLRETQAQLIQTEKLASLGGMVAGMAHEVNTPLGVAVTAASALDMWVERLRHGVADGTLTRGGVDQVVASLGEGLGATRRNLDRAVALMRSFKDIAVDQASEQRRRIEMRAYLGEVLNSLAPRLRRPPWVVQLDCPAGLASDTYPGALAQIVMNLVMNTVLHARPGGEGGRIELKIEPEADGYRLTYRDDGIGIPPDHLPRVFDPFFTTRRGSGGSGLGLHIVHNLATRLLGGAIAVQSEPGQGAEFVIRAPWRAPDAGAR